MIVISISDFIQSTKASFFLILPSFQSGRLKDSNLPPKAYLLQFHSLYL
jgi:hypothetical protein